MKLQGGEGEPSFQRDCVCLCVCVSVCVCVSECAAADDSTVEVAGTQHTGAGYRLVVCITPPHPLPTGLVSISVMSHTLDLTPLPLTHSLHSSKYATHPSNIIFNVKNDYDMNMIQSLASPWHTKPTVPPQMHCRTRDIPVNLNKRGISLLRHKIARAGSHSFLWMTMTSG